MNVVNSSGLKQIWASCILVLGLLVGKSRSRELCTDAQAQCNSRLGCRMALQEYMIECGALINGDADVCLEKCNIALVSLLSVEDKDGERFLNCDCNGNKFCKMQKRRVHVCTQSVMEAIATLSNESHIVSCELASSLCRSDTMCYTAYSYYWQHCSKLFKSERCTGRCKNSLSILYRQKRAAKLRTCRCDGPEASNCSTLKYDIQRLCHIETLTTTTSAPSTTKKHRHHHGKHDEDGEETKDNTVNYGEKDQTSDANVILPRASAANRTKSTTLILILIPLMALFLS